MSNLILPRQYAQMENPIVFWFSSKLDHIMMPASAVAPAPAGYQRIECRHAYEVDIWSGRLRAQEKRFFEMDDLQRFEYEGRVQTHIIEEMEVALKNCTDAKNKQFMAYFLDIAKRKRASRRPPEMPQAYMACEAEDGVAS